MVTSEAESSAPEQEEPSSLTIEENKNESIDSSLVQQTNIVKEEKVVSSETTYSETESVITSSINLYTDGINFQVPENQSGFKSWMPYTALSKSSRNYKMLINMGHVDENGLWMINEYYCVAMGSYYSKELGDLFEATLSNGNTVKLITADHKANIHTDSTHRVSGNGCMTEFIIDRSKLNSKIRTSGSVGSLSQFNGTYTKIVKIGNIFDEK